MYEKELQKFGNDTVNELIANYIRMGLRAFGEFERGLKSEVKGSNLTISAPYHARIMEDGRRAGKFPPPDEILKWVRLGKIVKRGDITDEQLAYLIGRKIAKEGIKVPNKYNIGSVISSVISDTRINELIQDISDLTVQNIQATMLKSFQNV
jgi:hypothetical protein